MRTFSGSACPTKRLPVVGNMRGKDVSQGSSPQSNCGFFLLPPLYLELGDRSFELKDFSRFFHDFFRKTIKMQVLSISIKSTFFELNLAKKLAAAAGVEPATCSLGESRSIQLSYATVSVSLRKTDGSTNVPCFVSSACFVLFSSMYIL